MQTTIMHRNSFQYYDHLGFFSPYYYMSNDGGVYFDQNFSKILTQFGSPLIIDPVAIAEVLSKRFMLGDRTLIQNVFRTPGLASFDQEKSEWMHLDIPKYQNRFESNEFIAEGLFALLCEEVKKYVGNSKSVGILLSGGMDSRMVAGVLDFLIRSQQLEVTSVTAYTWGNDDCRDVVYAETISKRLGWLWKRFTVSSSDLWENFKIAGYRGCEYSGIHLHAIPQIIKEANVEVILAGSYGDSIGRGEYEGIHIDRLTPIDIGFRNFGNLLKYKVYSEIKNLWQEDIIKYRTQYKGIKSYQQNELDYQLHYMRRMLNPCMELINEVIPTYQVFSSPAVYQFMWSFDSKCRNDSIYLYLMKLFKTQLDDIPWARTGLPYGTFQGEPDRYSKKHNSYSSFIQNDLINKIESRVNSYRIEKLSIFNKEAIRFLIKLIRTYPNYNIDYLERLTWLVSLDYFLEEHEDIKVKVVRESFVDYFTTYLYMPMRYLALRKFRTIQYKLDRK